MNERPEEKLVSAAKNGDKDAYSALIEKYYKDIFSVCLGIVGNAADAEDIAQDSLLTGYLKIKKLYKSDHFGRWVIAIARNLCIDLLRRRKHVKAILAEHRDETMPAVSINEIDIEKQLRKLPLDLRLPLVMFYFENKNAKKIAEILNISHSNACSKIREARRQLHIILSERVKNE